MIQAIFQTVQQWLDVHSDIAIAVTLFGFFFGGFVKGAIGFALPMIAVSFGASVMPPAEAVAYLAIPSLFSNLWQSLRDGIAEGLSSIREFRLLAVIMLVTIMASSQLLPFLDVQTFSGILGAGVALFALTQILGWKPRNVPRPAADVGAGLIGGFFGGISGAWGPPILMILLSLDLDKRALVRATGVTFLLGSVPFIIGHALSGVLNLQTLVISALLLVPTFAGMWLGQIVQDRLDAASFRRLVLLVLCAAGLNFLRRAFFG